MKYLQKRVEIAMTDQDIELEIVRILRECVEPYVISHGGQIEFSSYEDGVVFVELSGQCGDCPSSIITLKSGIERLLVEEIPDVKRVERV